MALVNMRTMTLKQRTVLAAVVILFGSSWSACAPGRVQTSPQAPRPTSGNPGQSVYRAGDPTNPPDLVLPIPIRQVEPRYTAAAMNASLEGSVDVELTVQTNGTVGDVRVTRSLDKVLGLDDEAIRAARRWLFQPGMLSGGPRVPVRLTVTLHFQLG